MFAESGGSANPEYGIGFRSYLKGSAVRKKAKTSIYLTTAQDAALRRIAETGVPIAALIRDGVDRVIRAYTEKPHDIKTTAAVMVAENMGEHAHPDMRRLADGVLRLDEQLSYERAQRQEREREVMQLRDAIRTVRDRCDLLLGRNRVMED